MKTSIHAEILGLVALATVACSSPSSPSDGASVPGTGGEMPDAVMSTGGVPADTGGTVGTGGVSTGTSGAVSSGGVIGVGGAVASGGTTTARFDGAIGTGGAIASGGTTSTSGPTAQQILDKVAACAATATVAKGGFGLDGGKGNISIYQCQGVLYWKADMDVDCDGILTPPCDTDVTGQPQTSIVDDAPSGDVDATKLPYFVIPLGDPESPWYKSFGVELGQVGAIIYQGSVRYGIFADEAGGAFIGEASYAMCQLFLGKPTGGKDPCDPNQGGIDPAEVTYVTFTGAANRATGSAIYSHDTHSTMGAAAASQWLSK
jgi:hypothetical protein